MSCETDEEPGLESVSQVAMEVRREADTTLSRAGALRLVQQGRRIDRTRWAV